MLQVSMHSKLTTIDSLSNGTLIANSFFRSSAEGNLHPTRRPLDTYAAMSYDKT